MANFDVTLEIRGTNVNTRVRELTASNKELSKATREVGDANRTTMAASQRLADAERRRMESTARLVQNTKKQIESLREYQQALARTATAEAARAAAQTASQRATVVGTGNDPRSTLGNALTALLEKERQLRAAVQDTVAEIVRAEQVAGNVAGMQKRTQEMQEHVNAVRMGIDAERAYLEMMRIRAQVEASGAQGRDEVAAIEREAKAQQKLQEELGELARARERDAAASREAAAQVAAANAAEQERTTRLNATIESLRRRTREMENQLRASRGGAAAEREYIELLRVREQIEASGARTPAEIDAVEREIQAQRRLAAELAEVKRARERSAAAAREAANLQAGINTEIARLREETDQLGLMASAHRRGARAIQETALQLQIRNALLRAGVKENTADAAAIEQQIRAQARFRREIEQTTSAARSQEGALGSLRNAFFALQAIIATLGLSALIRDAVAVTLAFDRAGRTMLAVSGQQAIARAEMGYVRSESERLGLSITETARSYAQLAANAKGTAVEGHQLRQVFSALAETSTVLGLSTDQFGGAINALSQMLGKATVQSEELRGQLSERIPGAYQMAARAMGLTTQQLSKQLEQGKILAKDLLPKLAEEMRKTFGSGLAASIVGAQAQLNRLQNDILNIKSTIGEGFLRGFLAGFEELRAGLNSQELLDAANRLGETLGSALRTTADAAMFLVENLDVLKAMLLIFVSMRVAAWFTGLIEVIVAAGGAIRVFGAIMAAVPILALVAGLAYAVVKLDDYIDAQERAYQIEMKRTRDGEDLLHYIDILKGATEGLTRAEKEHAEQVRQSIAAEIAAAQAALDTAKARAVGMNWSEFFGSGFMTGLHQRTEGEILDTEEVESASRNVERLTNILRMLDSQLVRLSKLPPPIDPEELSKLEAKLDDILEKFRRQAEQAEMLADAQRMGAEAARLMTESLERENAAYQALNNVEGLSAQRKAELAAKIEAYVLRVQEAQRAQAALVAEQQRDLEFQNELLMALARLKDEIDGTSVATIRQTAAIEARAIATREGRAEDLAYIETLTQQNLWRATVLKGIENETRERVRLREAQFSQLELEAQLNDEINRTTRFTKAHAAAVELENLRIEEGVELGSARYKELKKEVEARHAATAATTAQTAAQRRLNEAQDATKRAQAEFLDWRQQADAVKRFGSEVAGILQQYGFLNQATTDLAYREEALNIVREEGIDIASAAGQARLATVEQELRAQDEQQKQLRRMQAQYELLTHLTEPLRDAWRQTGETIKGVVVDLIMGVETDWKQLLKQMIAQWVAAFVEMAARAAATKFALNFVSGGQGAGGLLGGGGGGGMGWLSTAKGAWDMWKNGQSAWGAISGPNAPAWTSTFINNGANGIYGPTAGGGNLATGGLTTAGTAVAVAAVGLAIVAAFKLWLDKREEKKYKDVGQTFQFGYGMAAPGTPGYIPPGTVPTVPGGSPGAGGDGGGLTFVNKDARVGPIGNQNVAGITTGGSLGQMIGAEEVEKLRKLIEDNTIGLVKNLGGVVLDLKQFNLNIRNDGKEFKVTVDGIEKTFKTIEEALSHGITSMLAGGEYEGLSQNVRNILANANKIGLEGLQGMLDLAQKADAALSGSISGITPVVSEFEKQMNALKADIAEQTALGLKWGISIESLNALGEKRIEQLKMEQDAAAGQQVATVLEQLFALSPQAAADAELAMIYQRAVGAMRVAQLQMEADKLAALGYLTVAQMNLIQGYVDALNVVDVGAASIGSGPQEDPGAAQRESRRAELWQILRDLDNGGAKAAGSLAAALDNAVKLADEMRTLNMGDIYADKMQRLATLAAGAEFLKPFEEILNSAGKSSGQQKWDEIGARYDQFEADLLAGAEQLTAAGFDVQAAMEKLRAAEAAERNAAGRELVATFSAPMVQLKTDAADLADRLNLLSQAVVAGAVSAADAASIQRYVADQAFLGMADGLLGMIDRYYGQIKGFEDIRAQMAELRFSMELAQYRLQFDLIKAMGLLTEEQVSQIEGLFAFIEANPPNFQNVPGGSGAGPGGIPDITGPNPAQQAAEELARKRAAALARLAQYEELGLSPLQREINRVNAEFTELRAVLGNTARVQAAYALALKDIMTRAFAPLRQMYESLNLSQFSPLQAADRLAQAQAQFQASLAALQAGDLSQLDSITGLAQQLLQEAQNALPQGSEGYNAIFTQVQAAIANILRQYGQLPAGSGPPNGGGLSTDGPGLGGRLIRPNGGPASEGPKLELSPVTTQIRQTGDQQSALLRRIEANTRSAASEVRQLRNKGMRRGRVLFDTVS